MDIATFLGIVGGILFVIFGITQGGSISTFIDPPSMLITFGGAIMATVTSFRLDQILASIQVLKVAFFSKTPDYEGTIKTLVALAERARREGLLSLDEEISSLDDDFLKRGIQLVVDGVDPELIRNILETELSFIEERHKVGIGIFETLAGLGPSFGLLGTVIGLIRMLKQLNDPSTIGPSMALALITTFYGAFLAYVIAAPIANKLKLKSSDESLLRAIEIEGILSIQAGENPRILEQKLHVFLSPKVRKKVQQEREVEEIYGVKEKT
ncbi:MAG: motility protein A [bacterium]